MDGQHLIPISALNQKLSPGNSIDPFIVRTIHGKEVSIPDREGRWTHLQFRRFAGCPICNLHLQTFIRNHHDVEQAGIREVVFFHSSDASLLPYQGHFPFDVVGDPGKKFYKQFGVESSPLAILSPSAWGAMVKGNLARDKPAMKGFPENGPFGLPADFLISPEGKLVAVHYGSHAYDQWSVEDVLAKLKTC